MMTPLPPPRGKRPRVFSGLSGTILTNLPTPHRTRISTAGVCLRRLAHAMPSLVTHGLVKALPHRPSRPDSYCSDGRCQVQKPEQQQCATCQVWKWKRECFRNDGKRSYSNRCTACEYPSCANCGKKYTGQRAVKRNAPSICSGQWYCNDVPCFRRHAVLSDKRRWS